jgi:hypothetical protein
MFEGRRKKREGEGEGRRERDELRIIDGLDRSTIGKLPRRRSANLSLIII